MSKKSFSSDVKVLVLQYLEEGLHNERSISFSENSTVEVIAEVPPSLLKV